MEPSEDMRKIVRQPSEDMWEIVRQFQQDVEDVLEYESTQGDGDMDLKIKHCGAKMMCSIVEHLAEQGLLSILEEKTGRDYGVFCELK